jgi:hypothetical protein
MLIVRKVAFSNAAAVRVTLDRRPGQAELQWGFTSTLSASLYFSHRNCDFRLQ